MIYRTCHRACDNRSRPAAPPRTLYFTREQKTSYRGQRTLEIQSQYDDVQTTASTNSWGLEITQREQEKGGRGERGKEGQRRRERRQREQERGRKRERESERRGQVRMGIGVSG